MLTEREKILEGFEELEKELPKFGISALPMIILKDMVIKEFERLDSLIAEKNI